MPIARAELRITPGYTLNEIIDHAIRATVKRFRSKRRAAKELNISTRTVYNHMGSADAPRNTCNTPRYRARSR